MLNFLFQGSDESYATIVQNVPATALALAPGSLDATSPGAAEIASIGSSVPSPTAGLCISIDQRGAFEQLEQPAPYNSAVDEVSTGLDWESSTFSSLVSKGPTTLPSLSIVSILALAIRWHRINFAKDFHSADHHVPEITRSSRDYALLSSPSHILLEPVTLLAPVIGIQSPAEELPSSIYIQQPALPVLQYAPAVTNENSLQVHSPEQTVGSFHSLHS